MFSFQVKIRERWGCTRYFVEDSSGHLSLPVLGHYRHPPLLSCTVYYPLAPIDSTPKLHVRFYPLHEYCISLCSSRREIGLLDGLWLAFQYFTIKICVDVYHLLVYVCVYLIYIENLRRRKNIFFSVFYLFVGNLSYNELTHNLLNLVCDYCSEWTFYSN